MKLSKLYLNEMDNRLRDLEREAKNGDEESINTYVQNLIRSGYDIDDAAVDDEVMLKAAAYYAESARNNRPNNLVFVDRILKQIYETNGQYLGQDWARELDDYPVGRRRTKADGDIISTLVRVGDLIRSVRAPLYKGVRARYLSFFMEENGIELPELIKNFVI